VNFSFLACDPALLAGLTGLDGEACMPENDVRVVFVPAMVNL
jgi:hypothetical protein